MKLTPRRLGASAIGLAGVAALAVGVLPSLPAVAANASSISASTTSLQAAAGTCVVVSFQPLNQFGEIAQSPDTLTVTLTESPESASQDVDFCSVGATTPTESPSYINGNDAPPPGMPQTYTPGPGVTGNGFSSGGNPDKADDSTDSQSASLCGTACANSNPSGVDRARYAYQPGNGPIRVGVVGLTAGGATIRAFIDEKTANGPLCQSGGDYSPNCGEKAAPPVSFKITNGGQPGTTQASDAVTAIDIQPANGVGAPGAPQTFNAILRNSDGDTVRGVTPRIQAAAGGANPSAPVSCGQSDNTGVSACTFTGTNPGSDQLTIWVQKAGAGQTAGVDPNEVSKTTTRTTTKPAVSSSEARYLDMTPKSSVLTSGQSATYTATITDVNGAPARLVSVTFTKTGPGSFAGGASSVAGTTDDTGRAFVSISTAIGESGTISLTGTIATPGTQCSSAAGSGNGATSSTPAGRCQDTAIVTVSGASSSPSATPSSSATPTATTSPSSGPPTRSLTLSLDSPGTIKPGVQSIMTARGTPGAGVVLRCYSRTPQNSGEASPPYFDARTATLDSNGAWQFALNPGTNTRCFVKYAGAADSDTRNSASVVQNVATDLSLSAYRDDVRTYHFQGTNLPRRAGQLITLYRYATGPRLDQYCVPAPESYSPSSSSGCTAIRTATAYTNSTNVWRIDRTFSGSGQFYFVARTSQTLTNAAGFSNQRLTIIH